MGVSFTTKKSSKNKEVDTVMPGTIMTSIVNMVPPEDVMERIIDVTAARRQFGTLLDEVFHKGDVVTIERKGKPLAKIVPLEDSNDHVLGRPSTTSMQKKLLKELNSLPRIGIDQNPVDILRSMRKQKKIKATIRYGK